MLNANRADVYTDLNALAKLKTEARKESPEALKETAKQFEAVFLNHVLKAMRDTKLGDGILDNDQSKFYGEMYDQQLASNLAGSVGLADLIVKQMKHEDSREEKPEKMNLEDYLNRSSTVGRAMPGRHGEVDSHAIGNAGMKPANAEPETGNKAFGDEFAVSSDFPAVPAQQAQQAGSKAVSIPPVSAQVRAENGIQDSALKNFDVLPIKSAQDFVRHLHPIAEQAARELGVEPKVLLAQAALETNWGRSLIKNRDGESTFNLFNIKAGKAWRGDKARAETLEYEHGVGRKRNAGFRAYESFEESFQDYVRLIKSNPRYGDALKQAGSPEHYLRGLQKGGYATDPKYAEKIMQIYRGNTMNNMQPDLVVAMNDQA